MRLRNPPVDVGIDLHAALRRHLTAGRLWCPVRRAFLAPSPEEMVRMACIYFLIDEKGISPKRIAVEKAISSRIKSRRGRYDLLIYDRSGKPLLLIECKAPKIALSPQSFTQILVYNYEVKAPYLWLTNGISNYFIHVDVEHNTAHFIEQFPPL